MGLFSLGMLGMEGHFYRTPTRPPMRPVERETDFLEKSPVHLLPVESPIYLSDLTVDSSVFVHLV